jgi:hypothetical protein
MFILHVHMLPFNKSADDGGAGVAAVMAAVAASVVVLVEVEVVMVEVAVLVVLVVLVSAGSCSFKRASQRTWASCTGLLITKNIIAGTRIYVFRSGHSSPRVGDASHGCSRAQQKSQISTRCEQRAAAVHSEATGLCCPASLHIRSSSHYRVRIETKEKGLNDQNEVTETAERRATWSTQLVTRSGQECSKR